MAIVRAVKSGNWSDVTVWNTGALPTSADDVYSNTFTVTIDISPTVLSISNASTTGVTAGGSFAISANGITLTANVTGFGSGCLSVSIGLGSSATIIGNCSASNVNSGAVNLTGLGTLNITGNVTGGSAGSNATGVSNTSGGTINITGNCTGANNSSHGVNNASTGTINITGDCTGGTGNNAYGVVNSSTGVVNVTGRCIGGSAAYNLNSLGAVNNSSGTMTVVGTVMASGTLAGVGGVNNVGTLILTGPFLTVANGTNPITASRWFWANSNVTPTYYQIRTANLATIRPLYTADSVGGNPAVTNVRSGTVYGPAGELTGTCAVPPAGSVALGVPVDNTTGTALITEASIANALSTASAVTLNQQTSTLTTPGSIGQRLALSSTVATTAQQLSDALSNE